MKRSAKQATECLEKEFALRGLALPEQLADELRALCMNPDVAARVCAARLENGEAVIEQRGGIKAPDRLWQRFEALIATQLCCEEANRKEQERVERRMKRERMKSITRTTN